jgi:tRNA splicing endonuclease
LFGFRFVVRSGLNFGMDYGVYRLNPSKCHSEICVQVIDATGELPDRYLSWRNISTTTRVMPVRNCVNEV